VSSHPPTLKYPFTNTFQANGIFELQVTNDAKETVTWTIDMKKTGTVYKGKALPKADVTIILADDTLVDLSSGKVCCTFIMP